MSATWTATVDEVVWTATDFPTVTFETFVRTGTDAGGGAGSSVDWIVAYRVSLPDPEQITGPTIQVPFPIDVGGPGVMVEGSSNGMDGIYLPLGPAVDPEFEGAYEFEFLVDPLAVEHVGKLIRVGTDYVEAVGIGVPTLLQVIPGPAYRIVGDLADVVIPDPPRLAGGHPSIDFLWPIGTSPIDEDLVIISLECEGDDLVNGGLFAVNMGTGDPRTGIWQVPWTGTVLGATVTEAEAIQGVDVADLRHNDGLKVSDGWRGQRIVLVQDDTSGRVTAREMSWLTPYDVTSPEGTITTAVPEYGRLDLDISSELIADLHAYTDDAVAAGGGGGATDHGALAGLADDDHTQYALADGTRGAFLRSDSGSNTPNGWLKLDGAATVPDILIPSSIARDSEVTSAISAYAQPLDSDLTDIAALTTESYGRSLLTLANEAAMWALHPPVPQVRGCPTAAADDWVPLSTLYGSTPTVSVIGGSAALSSGRAIYLPFTVDRAISVTGLGIEVSTGNAGGSAVLRLGIHSDSGGRPGTVVVDTTATATAAAKEATFSSTALAPGHYWAVIAFQSLDTAGVNPQVRTTTSPISTANRTAMVTGSNQGATFTATVTGALADTPTVSLTTPIVPFLFLKVGTP